MCDVYSLVGQCMFCKCVMFIPWLESVCSVNV